MLKNSTLNQICMYDYFYQGIEYTISELLVMISLGIQCFMMFDNRVLEDDGVKRLRREWCKLLRVEESNMTVVYGLTSRCVESPLCFAFTVQARREEIAGAPRTSICDLITYE